MSPSAKLVSLATAVPPNVLSQSDVAAAANQCFGGRYDEFERLARVFKSSAIRRRHAVRPIDWYLTPLGWPERATVYLEGACELFVDAAKQQGARSYERASCSRSCCLSSGFTAALEFICGCA
jgi:alkylresorcinol/alkylpyrone synthase